jgi:tRNA dimethylallyltransferase
LGPSASGKTGLLEKLFIRDAFCPAEIISADSMQVYRGMDIGTAKPSAEERGKRPHHLIDIRDPHEQFNAGEFVRLASDACGNAISRGVLPVVSGGTGFYLKNLVLGLPEAPPSDAALREDLRKELGLRGAASLMEELAAFDPLSAGRIHINDQYRLLRALEVFRLSGRPLSSFAVPGAGSAGDGHPFRFLILGINREREDLYRRIDRRCAAMFRAGLAEEVRRLHDAGVSPDDPGFKAIGYREFFVGGGENRRLSEDLAGVEALVAQNTRHYVKRQMTFFASIPGVKWITVREGENPLDRIKRELEREIL